MFFYAGVAKLNGDWLRGEPLRAWLADRTDFAVIGRFFTRVVGALVLQLQRPAARPADRAAAALAAHPAASRSPRRSPSTSRTRSCSRSASSRGWRSARRCSSSRRTGHACAGCARSPGESARRAAEPARLVSTVRRPLSRARWVVVGLLAAYFAVQVLAPLRHFAYPGNVSWTEEGHQFAWHMKLRDKEADARFFVTDGQTRRARGSSTRSSISPTGSSARWPRGPT